jgi:hypothetical protein
MKRNITEAKRCRFTVNFGRNSKKTNITESGKEDMREFEEWIEDNYPEIKLPEDYLDVRTGHSKILIGLFLVLVVTGVVGALTHFKVGIPSHACWLLLWLYGGPTFRLKWLINQSVDNKPCLSYGMFLLYWALRVCGLLIVAGVYCGITVISVELLGAFCGETISLSGGTWIGIGAIILVVLVLVGIIVCYYNHIWGTLFLCLRLILAAFVRGQKVSNSAPTLSQAAGTKSILAKVL